MKPKLEMLITDNESFGSDAKNFETGIMINEFNDSIDSVMLEFDDRYEVYLNLYDERPPFRNVLAKGVAKNIRDAKEIANKNLIKIAYKNWIYVNILDTNKLSFY